MISKGDLLKITLQDSSSNSVDVLLKLDATAVASLQRPNGNADETADQATRYVTTSR